MRRLILIGLIAVVACAATAQTRISRRMDVGAHAGVTFSRTNFRPSVPQIMVTGMTFGGSFRYIEERFFGLIGEINISQRGWKEKYEGLDLAYNRKLTYIEIPMLTHIYFGSERFRGFVNLGPQIGFMISKKINSNFDYTDLSKVADYPITNRETAELNMDIKYKLDYGITAGIGMEFQATRSNSFTLEGRFYYGLHDIFANHKSDVFSASNGMSIAVTLGYHYRIK